MSFATQTDGTLDTLPILSTTGSSTTTRSCSQQKGVAFPKTMDEMLTAARKLNDPANGIYGFVGRGLKNANVPVWTSLLLGQGQETIDDNGERC